MLLYRSIGTREFNALLSNKIIEGKYNLSKEKQSSFDEEGLYVCFFEDEYWWLDSGLGYVINYVSSGCKIKNYKQAPESAELPF